MDDNGRMHRVGRIVRLVVVPTMLTMLTMLTALTSPGISSMTQVGSPSFGFGFGFGSPAAAQVPDPAPAPTTAVTTSTLDPLASSAAQTEPAGANTPQRTGRDLPPRSQRISDTLIWLFLVLLLVGGVLLAVFPGQVRSVPRPPSRR